MGYDLLLKDLLDCCTDPHAETSQGDPRLSLDIDHGFDQAVKAIIENGYDLVVKELPVHGVAMDAKNNNVDSQLHLATCEGYDQVVKQLLEFAADFNTRNRDRATRLQLAARGGQAQVVKQLLALDAKNSRGQKP